MARRLIGVTLLLVLSALTWTPDLRRVAGHPLGIMGFTLNYEDVVTGVNKSARDAGVRPGDRFDRLHATGAQRLQAGGVAGTADAGMRLDMPMLRGTTRYTAHLTTFAESPQTVRMVWLRDAAQLFVMLLGALVVLRRPGPATWGFLLAVFSGCAPVNVIYHLGPDWWRTVGHYLFWVVVNDTAGAYGAIFFAIYLLHDGPLPAWRRITQAVTFILTALAFAISVWQATTLVFSAYPNSALWVTYSVFSVLPFFLAPLILIATYFESSANVRERLRWIIGGFLLSFACNAADQMGSQGNLGLYETSYVTHSFLVCGMYLFMAMPVAYAVLKHHIIDINVAISRATVYTALSVFIVGLFALVDLFFTRALDQKSAGLIADIGLALLLGFSFNTMHRRVDGFVDRFLFRKRHLAEEHVRQVTDALSFAHSEAHVRTILTKEPVRAFNLSGARILSGLSDASDDVMTLASFLEAKRGAVRVMDGPWNLRASVYDEFAPVVAIPVLSHGTVTSMVLYGLHNNGTDLDAEEITLLEALGSAAGAALDRLEAESLRHEIDMLRSMVRA
ncbi:MAG TPA: hypothetical protein VJP85_11180 [Candidatus Baltobacteraceae bacterium]|nr:hypothetical protein [Candidatus Baltobacteraceae bacterium]